MLAGLICHLLPFLCSWVQLHYFFNFEAQIHTHKTKYVLQFKTSTLPFSSLVRIGCGGVSGCVRRLPVLMISSRRHACTRLIASSQFCMLTLMLLCSRTPRRFSILATSVITRACSRSMSTTSLCNQTSWWNFLTVGSNSTQFQGIVH